MSFSHQNYIHNKSAYGAQKSSKSTLLSEVTVSARIQCLLTINLELRTLYEAIESEEECVREEEIKLAAVLTIRVMQGAVREGGGGQAGSCPNHPGNARSNA